MFALFKSHPVRKAAELAYSRVVEYARRPQFYGAGGVPDTVDGRFELICLHAFLYLHRLKQEPSTSPLAQAFFDAMFADFDRSLREIGIGDLSVGRHIRRMVEAFYGRIAAYETGLAGDDAALQEALARNVFGTTPEADTGCVAILAAYMRGEMAQMNGESLSKLTAGDIRFGELPAWAQAVA